MQFYHDKIFLDEFTPVSIYPKIKDIFPDELSFLFESVVNSSDGNFSYIIIGDRERLTHTNGKSFFIDENKNETQVQDNPMLFLKEYYKKINFDLYKEKSIELGVGLIDGLLVIYHMIWLDSLNQNCKKLCQI